MSEQGTYLALNGKDDATVHGPLSVLHSHSIASLLAP